jgi:DNA-binding NarL/FixJ family response regulator
MPVMNGLDAAVELGKLFPKVPLILFTMYDTNAVAAAASKVGINVVLSKSVDLATLTDEAHKLIAWRSKADPSRL